MYLTNYPYQRDKFYKRSWFAGTLIILFVLFLVLGTTFGLFDSCATFDQCPPGQKAMQGYSTNGGYMWACIEE